MNKKGNYTLEEFLRYFLAGGIFFLYMLILSEDFWGSFKLFPISDSQLGVSALFIGLILIVGSLIYTVHRSVLWPVILFLRITGDRISPSTDIRRWNRRRDKASIQHELSEWAAQIHFLFCATWALLLANFVGIPIFKLKLRNPELTCFLRVLPAIILFVIGLVSAYRYHRRERLIDQCDHPKVSPPRSDFLYILGWVPLPMITIVLLSKRGTILLGKRKEEPGKGKWSVPCGLIRKAESLEDAYERIGDEEFGLKLNFYDARPLGGFSSYYEGKNCGGIPGLSTQWISLTYEYQVDVEIEIRPSQQYESFSWFQFSEVKCDASMDLNLLKILEKA